MSTSSPGNGYRQLFTYCLSLTLVLSFLLFILLPGAGAHPMGQALGFLYFLLIVVPANICVVICGACLVTGHGKALPLSGMLLAVTAIFTLMIRMIIPVQEKVVAIPLFAGLYSLSCTTFRC